MSGGPDSTALLLLIDRWRHASRVPVAVATVDHCLRKESGHEAQAVATLCDARGLPHRTLVYEGAPLRTRIQERAREARYGLLTRHAGDIGADTIVTAHHADDQAETILMRLLRGSGPAGLAGMAPSVARGALTIARPLLHVPKARLVEICRAETISFQDDPTNRSERFLRTRLRDLAPVLAREGLTAAALGRLGRRAARAEHALLWAEATARASLDVRRTATGTTMPAERFAIFPEEVAIRIVAAELTATALGAAIRLSRLETLVAKLRAAIDDRVPFAATLGGCVVRLRGDIVVIEQARARRPSLSTTE